MVGLGPAPAEPVTGYQSARRWRSDYWWQPRRQTGRMDRPPACDTFGRVDASDVNEESAASTKARRSADAALVGTYYEAGLAELLERVRDGFARYDAGELDAFELDYLIHRYKRATRELWKLCGNVTGSSVQFVARMLEEMQTRGETIDWWERGNPPRDRA